jgi:hypothetical protein
MAHPHFATNGDDFVSARPIHMADSVGPALTQACGNSS